MNASDATFSRSTTSCDGSKQFSAVRLPIEEPIDDFEDAVENLKACSPTELRRAYRHHRRAIEALQEGGYNALSEATRNDLLAHLRCNLKALNEALDATARSPSDSMSSDAEDPGDSLSSRARSFVQGLW